MALRFPDDLNVDEQYSDILIIVSRLLSIIGKVELDNHQPLGRLSGALQFLKQEVEAKRFPIPGSRDHVSTVAYLAGNPMFPKGFPDISEDLYGIVSLVECDGFIKPRHYPRFIELICEMIKLTETILSTDDTIVETERQNLEDTIRDYRKMCRLLHAEKLDFQRVRADFKHFFNLKPRFRLIRKHEALGDAESEISGPLTGRWRPRQSQPTPGWVMPDWVKEPMVDKG